MGKTSILIREEPSRRLGCCHVVINAQRGVVTREMPAHNGFNHVILAIKLPDDLHDPSLIAVMQHPKLGRILFFDPTNDVTPFGQIGGYLQANYGLLALPDGGELVELPQQPSAMNNSIQRVGKLTLDANGILKGDVEEMRVGDRAASERWRLRTVTKNADRIKPIESLLAGSLPSFQIMKASLINFEQTDQPFGFRYTFQSDNYAKLWGASRRGYWRPRSRESFRSNSKGRRVIPTASKSRCRRAMRWRSYRLQWTWTTALAAITVRP